MFQVNKSSNNFWNNLKLTWQQCTDLPSKYWATSVAELDGKVYIAALGNKIGCNTPFMYVLNMDQWFSLPALPYACFSLVTVHDRKQVLAIGGMVKNINAVIEVSNKVFLWDEENMRWTTPYPNMPTARYGCSSISHGSTVIVAGGITCLDPFIMTRAVEVLHIEKHSFFKKSYWSVVEQLPHVVCEAIPLIVNDQLYIAVGYDKKTTSSTCNVITASLTELLQSSNKNTSSGQVWNKLPDMPYSSFSINHYQGHLITFGGAHYVEKVNIDKPVPLVHIYNPHSNTWDCVGDIPYEYLLGKSVYNKGDQILFIGGVTGTCDPNNDDDMITTNLILTLSPQ